MITLYDYVSGTEIRISAERINDTAARRLLPQDALTQELYDDFRAAGSTPIGAMNRALLLKIAAASTAARAVNWGSAPVERSIGGAPAAASSNERQGVAMTGGYFELRSDEETNRRYWWGSEDGWKDATEIGQDGVLTLDAGAFVIGTTLRLSEPDGVAMTEAERLNALKRAAWNAGDLDLYDFYSRLGYELGRLRIVGKVVASIYQKAGFVEDNWQALFEALADAGLLDDGSDDRLGRE